MKDAHARLERAALSIGALLVAGQRDPRWAESVELEEAAIAFYRAYVASPRNKPSEPTTIAGARASCLPPPVGSPRSCVDSTSTPSKAP